jgi:imidazolonepropionase-like amidohydrolase
MGTLLRGGWVLDEHGTAQPGLDVHVVDGLIAAVGPGLEAEGATVVDCTGATVMPGLIDCHVHLTMAGPSEPDGTLDQARARAAANARQLLEAGVTTARDASGPADVLLGQRELCAQDLSAGPQLLVCCEGIACVDGHGTEFAGSAKIVTEVDGPDAAREAVRRLVEIGADWVKVMLNGANDQVELDEEHLRAIVAEARQLGIPVAAHASNPSAVALAVRCKVDSIEHGNDIDDELAAAMAADGIAMVTTTYLYRAGAGCAHFHGDVDPLESFKADVREQVRSIMSVRVAAHEKAVPAAKRAGAPIALGTDSVIGPVDLVVDELQALTVLGLTPAEALRAGTVAGAELLRLPDRGRVAPGLRADLLVVRGRPDEDVSAVADPVLVVRGGTVVVDRRSS